MTTAILSAAVAGLAATILMIMVELPLWRQWGLTAVLEWEVNGAIVSGVMGTRYSRNPKLSLALASHLFHGTVAGIVFSLLLPILPSIPGANISIVLDAVMYSIILWFLFSVLPKSTFESSHIPVTRQGLLGALLSHLVYGAALGVLVVMIAP